MSRRRPILVALLLGALAALIGLSLITVTGDDWKSDRVTDARFDASRTRLMIWTEDGYNHPSCTETAIELDAESDVWHVSMRVRRTSELCELDAPITEDGHDAWVDFDEPVREGVTVSWSR